MDQNLSLGQRAMYVIAGLGLAASAARPRPNPLLSLIAFGAGSYLAWNGYRGHCPVKAALIDDNGFDMRRLQAH